VNPVEPPAWSGISGSPAVVSGSLLNNAVITTYLFHHGGSQAKQIYMTTNTDRYLANSEWTTDTAVPGAATSQDSIGVAIYDQLLYLVWEQLSPTQYYVWATFDGINWSNISQQGISNELTPPALCVNKQTSPTNLELIYASNNNNFYLSSSTLNASAPLGWNPETTIGSPQSQNQITCIPLSNDFLYVWQGAKCSSKNNYYQTTWSQPTTFLELPMTSPNCVPASLIMFPQANDLTGTYLFFSFNHYLGVAWGPKPGTWSYQDYVKISGEQLSIIPEGIASTITSGSNLAVFYVASSGPNILMLAVATRD